MLSDMLHDSEGPGSKESSIQQPLVVAVWMFGMEMFGSWWPQGRLTSSQHSELCRASKVQLSQEKRLFGSRTLTSTLWLWKAVLNNPFEHLWQLAATTTTYFFAPLRSLVSTVCLFRKFFRVGQLEPECKLELEVSQPSWVTPWRTDPIACLLQQILNSSHSACSKHTWWYLTCFRTMKHLHPRLNTPEASRMKGFQNIYFYGFKYGWSISNKYSFLMIILWILTCVGPGLPLPYFHVYVCQHGWQPATESSSGWSVGWKENWKLNLDICHDRLECLCIRQPYGFWSKYCS